MDMLGYNGFILQRDQKDSKESLAIVYTASYHKIPIKVISNYKEYINNWIPLGSIEFISQILGRNIPSALASFSIDSSLFFINIRAFSFVES